MVDSAFDAETFMATEVEAPMEVKYTPLPKGEYNAYIDEIEIRSVTGGALILDVNYIVNNPQLAEQLGLEVLQISQGIFLDVDDNGRLQIGPNKNVRLGRLREAVGQNTGAAWNFAMLRGAGPLMIHVEPDQKNADYSRVVRTLAPAAGAPALPGAAPAAPAAPPAAPPAAAPAAQPASDAAAPPAATLPGVAS